MTKSESFLNSWIYIGIVFFVSFVSWTLYKETPPYDFNLFNMIGMIILLLVMCTILVSYQNTMYTIPIVISILFILNKSDMTFETSTDLGFPIIAVSIFIIGFILHFIKYKPRLSKGSFFLGLCMIAIGYVVSLIYLPFDIKAIPVSLLGFVYLFLYVFYSSTAKSNLEYLFKILLTANLVLTAQIFVYVYRGFMTYTDLDFVTRLFLGWLRNLGWANTNDMCFYIALTFPSYVYFMVKHPKKIVFWFLALLPAVAIIFTKSRGGLVSFGLSGLSSLLFFYFKGPKVKKGIWLALLVSSFVVVLLNYRIFIEWLQLLINFEGEDLNSFMSNRIYFYKEGISIFLKYPFFGGGWLSILSFPFEGRLFMYHSTIIQALATMGLFGIVALIIHFIEVFRYMFHNVTVEKLLFLIGFISSQIHGLIDNVQYSVPFSVIIVLILSIFETSNNYSNFVLEDNRYMYTN